MYVAVVTLKPNHQERLCVLVFVVLIPSHDFTQSAQTGSAHLNSQTTASRAAAVVEFVPAQQPKTGLRELTAACIGLAQSRATSPCPWSTKSPLGALRARKRSQLGTSTYAALRLNCANESHCWRLAFGASVAAFSASSGVIAVSVHISWDCRTGAANLAGPVQGLFKVFSRS